MSNDTPRRSREHYFKSATAAQIGLVVRRGDTVDDQVSVPQGENISQRVNLSPRFAKKRLVEHECFSRRGAHLFGRRHSFSCRSTFLIQLSCRLHCGNGVPRLLWQSLCLRWRVHAVEAPSPTISNGNPAAGRQEAGDQVVLARPIGDAPWLEAVSNRAQENAHTARAATMAVVGEGLLQPYSKSGPASKRRLYELDAQSVTHCQLLLEVVSTDRNGSAQRRSAHTFKHSVPWLCAHDAQCIPVPKDTPG